MELKENKGKWKCHCCNKLKLTFEITVGHNLVRLCETCCKKLVTLVGEYFA